jgi:Tol biopolymer transport system component
MRRSWAVVALSLVAAGPARSGLVELVSRAATFGETAAGYNAAGSFSADSRYVVYASVAPNLVPGVLDLNGGYDVFLFDRVAGSTILVSASSTSSGSAANGISTLPMVSADGRYVVYQSTATDLVPGQADANGKSDVFLFDRISGATSVISHTAGAGSQTSNGVSQNPSMSEDGRFVTFASGGSDLVAGLTVTPASNNVFLWDRATGALQLVTHAAGSSTTGGDNDSRFPQVSRDGSMIAFFSFAGNLVAGQTGPNVGSVYAWGRASGITSLVSHAAGAPLVPANGTSDLGIPSADGRYVVFRSGALNLVAGQVSTYGYSNIFLHDRLTDTTVLASSLAGSPSIGATGTSDFCQISADGRFVAYMSTAPDLVGGFIDGNGASAVDVYLYDRLAGSSSLVSRHAGSSTTSANGGSFLSSVSADGRLVSFWSRGTDVVAGQTGSGGFENVFVYDRLSATSRLVSHVPGSTVSGCNSHSAGSTLSSDGTFLLFGSSATDVLTGLLDSNGVADLFLFDAGSGANSLVTRRAPEAPTLSGNDYSTYAAGYARAMSDDGRFIAYLSRATNLVSGQIDGNGATDVFLFDRQSRSSVLVSHAAVSPVTAGNAVSTGATVSADARWVAFSSRAGDLISGAADTAGFVDAFLYDRLSGMSSLVSRSAGASIPANGDSFAPIISGDGRFLVFTSSATDLVAGQVDANASSDVFLYDRVANATTLVSHQGGLATTAGNGASMNAQISRDGAVVAFVSGATNLAAGKPGAFLFERATGLVTFVGPADPSLLLALSEDGNWVAYASSAANVVPGQVQGFPGTNVFLFDRAGGGTTLASRQSGSATTTANKPSGTPSLSSDGRFLAFQSDATDLVAGVADLNGRQDVFLFDRADGGLHLVSAAASGGPATVNSWSAGPVVSADGSHVAFVSNATNVVPGQNAGGGFGNLFLYSRATASSILATGSLGSATTGGNDDTFPASMPVGMSAAGDVLAFQSYASDLVLGDYNGTADFFAFSLRYEGSAASFNTLAPCRLADTRGTPGPFGAPVLAANSSRTFVLALRCGIPSDAVAVSANLTVVDPAADGALASYPAGFAAGGTSTINFRAGQTRANNAVLGLGAGGATAVDVGSSGPVHLVLDVNGYFK